MGVSVETTNPDLNAVVAGGDAFVSRMKELQAAKEAVQSTFDKLKLGNDAAAAYADAQQNQQTAKIAVAEAKDEASKIVADAKTRASDLVAAATADAQKIATESASTLATFNTDLDAARKTLAAWSSQVEKEAKALQKKAQAKFDQAEAVLASNNEASTLIAADRLVLDEQIKSAKAAEADYNAKLAAIKAAVS